jgi:multidrug efflux pump subunit AcrA (membrane-fusion protein)
VAVGQTVLLRTDAFSSQRLEGRVREITPMGDAITKTYRIRIGLPDDTPLIAGMSVEANVITREKAGALLVPADAVQDASVLVIDHNRLRRRQIVIGIRGTAPWKCSRACRKARKWLRLLQRAEPMDSGSV